MEVVKSNRSKTYIAPLILKGFDVNTEAIVDSYLFNLNNLELNNPSEDIEGLFVQIAYDKETKSTFKYDSRCIHIQDVDEDTFIVFIRVTDFFRKDVQLLFNGKYSKISPLAKKEIIKFWKLSSTGKIVRILEKDEGLRKFMEHELNCSIDKDAELGDAIDINKETFKEKLLTV